MKQTRAARLFLPALFFLAWAILFTWPLALRLGDGVPLSAGGDAWLHLWDLWWADKSLVDLHTNPYFTTYLYYPTGLNLFYHSLDIFNGVASIPLQHLFGLTASFNLLLLANLTLDGLAAYWLCLELTGSAPGALVGGALFAAAPLLGTSVNLGQLDEVTAWWIPLYILALWRALDSPGMVWQRGGGRRAIICAGLCLAGASLATWYFTAGLAVFTALFTAGYLFTHKRQESTESRAFPGWAVWVQAASKVVAIVGVFVLLLLPLLWAMIAERLGGATYMLPAFSTTLANSADLAELFLPGRTEIIAISEQGSNVALGWVALGLSLVGLARTWRKVWPIGLALLGIVVMSLGPHLLLFGNDTGLPMPYTLLDSVPFIGASRQPLRLLATAAICLSMLAAYGSVYLLTMVGKKPWARAVIPAILTLVALELFGIPRAITSTAIGPAYSFIKDAQEPGAVMELPYALWQGRPQFYQSLHERPLLGGYTSRHFPYPFIESVPGASQLAKGLLKTLDQPDIISPTLKVTALASLDYYGVRYVVLHKKDVATGRFVLLVDLLKELYPGGPAYDDPDIAVYKTADSAATAPTTAALPLTRLGSGWYEVEENPIHRWISSGTGNSDAYVWIGIRPSATGQYTLSLDIFAYSSPRHLSIVLNGKTIFKKEIGLAPETLEVDLGNLPTGDYSLLLHADEPPTSPPGDTRLLSLGVTRLEVVRVQAK